MFSPRFRFIDRVIIITISDIYSISREHAHTCNRETGSDLIRGQLSHRAILVYPMKFIGCSFFALKRNAPTPNISWSLTRRKIGSEFHRPDSEQLCCIASAWTL